MGPGADSALSSTLPQHAGGAIGPFGLQPSTDPSLATITPQRGHTLAALRTELLERLIDIRSGRAGNDAEGLKDSPARPLSVRGPLGMADGR
jgi:hypothetical protein